MYLNAHTYYSLKYGTLSPKQLVDQAKKLGLRSLVLTDINNTSCTTEFIGRCNDNGIKPIVGVEFRRDKQFLYIGIAKNGEGFRQLNSFLSMHSLESKPLPDVPPFMEDTWIIYREAPKPLNCFRANEMLGIRPQDLNKLYASPLVKFMDKLLMFSPISYLDKTDYTTHKLLCSIDQNCLLSKLNPNYCAGENEYMIAATDLLAAYRSHPKIIRNTRHLIDSCSIELPTGFGNNRQSFTGTKDDDFKLLTKLAYGGLKKRYYNDQKATERVQKELKVIYRLDFCAYFLITWDIVRYAQSAGYHYVGRGSGANSIVAYCLHITDVDPLELDLYFERFINPHRSSPPDFDIDFSWDERDDVIDYVFNRYGKEYTALLGTYNTFKGKSIIRELGKVFGLPKAEIDKIVTEPHAVDQHHDLAKTIYKYGKRIEGFPNYLSIHAGGIIISDRHVAYHTSLRQMPKGFPISHFDMYHGEEMGFHKFDVLSQRGLGHIKDAVSLIKSNQGRYIDVHQVDTIKKDPKVRKQLRSGHCIGCFYIESPAMRGLLQKLRCETYIHLVAASSIIRPGVAQSGMMREYIYRFHNPNAFDYIHEVFEEHLGETFGVMVYQEDVMKIVHHFADLDLDESDILRRMMTGKKSNSEAYARLKTKYFTNCETKGYSNELAQEVWRQIESFSGYSFCKAHSASFAVESFQSLYLKAYYPLEFMVAVINNFGGFYRTEYYFHEARMQGANIHACCINKSEYLTTIYGKDIYIGFVHLHQMERKIAHAIVAERKLRGAFKSMEDFSNRVNISTEQLDILIRIGAFRFTGFSKGELMWRKHGSVHQTQQSHGAELFANPADEFELPQLQENAYDQAFDEIELLGFMLCSPFDLLEKIPAKTILAKELKPSIGKRVRMLGYYVCQKNVRTSNNKNMHFGTWLDQNGYYFDTTHFPPSAAAYPFRGRGCYLLMGKVTSDFDFPSIEVERMEKLPFRKDNRY